MDGGLLVSSRRDVVSLLFVKGDVCSARGVLRDAIETTKMKRETKNKPDRKVVNEVELARLPVQVGGRAWVSLFCKRRKRATGRCQGTSKKKKTADSPNGVDCPRFSWWRVNTLTKRKAIANLPGLQWMWFCEPTKPPVCVYWGIKASVPRDI